MHNNLIHLIPSLLLFSTAPLCYVSALPQSVFICFCLFFVSSSLSSFIGLLSLYQSVLPFPLPFSTFSYSCSAVPSVQSSDPWPSPQHTEGFLSELLCSTGRLNDHTSTFLFKCLQEYADISLNQFHWLNRGTFRREEIAYIQFIHKICVE